MTPTLSDVQYQILHFIKHHIEHVGYPPTVREISAAVHLRSTSAVMHQLRQLETKGYLRRDHGKDRALVLTLPEGGLVRD